MEKKLSSSHDLDADIHVELDSVPMETLEVDSQFSEENDSLQEQLFYLPKFRKKRRKWFLDVDFIKLVIMLIMVFTFFLAELVVGILTRSLALLADAFHMLSDGISLVIGITALVLSKRRGNERFTYGFERAETLGGLINSVFLLSAVLYIIMEAIERFGEPAFIQDPWLVFGVGGGGMLINIIGMIMFCGHAHGGHGHSHGGHGHSHESNSSHGHSHSRKKQKRKSHNMMGVFLHVFGDFLGSIGVMIAAILNIIFVKDVNQKEHVWVKYVDPTLSVLLALLILCTSIPLIIGTSKILLQSVPDAVNVKRLRQGLLQISGVSDIHELHVWSVAHGKKLIGSVHLSLDDSFDMHDWETLAHSAKDIFHQFGIHSTTIQPEISPRFLKRPDIKVEGKLCTQLCPTLDCSEDRCCPPASITMPKDLENRMERERNIRINRKPPNFSHGHSHSHGVINIRQDGNTINNAEETLISSPIQTQNSEVKDLFSEV